MMITSFTPLTQPILEKIKKHLLARLGTVEGVITSLPCKHQATQEQTIKRFEYRWQSRAYQLSTCHPIIILIDSPESLRKHRQTRYSKDKHGKAPTIIANWDIPESEKTYVITSRN